jgi:hypothetical protein
MKYDKHGRPIPIIVWTPLEARSAAFEKRLKEFLDAEEDLLHEEDEDTPPLASD